MTKSEFRKSKEYKELFNRIKDYPIGFEFTLNYLTIPKAKSNALNIITNDCIKCGILKSISIGLDIHGNFVEETYKRVG